MILGALFQRLKNSAIGRYFGGIGDVLSTLADNGSVSSLAAKFTGSHLTGAEREANAFSASQAELQRQFQEDMYVKYQSPQAMMRQYQDAGLNPALMYGSAPSNAMSTNVSAPNSVSPGAGLDLIGSLISMMSAKANIRKTNADAQGQEIRNEYLDSLLGAEISLSWAQAEQAIRYAEESSERRNLVVAETAESIARAGLVEKQGAESVARAALYAAERTLRETENNNAIKQGELLDNEVFVSTFEKNFVNIYGSRLNSGNFASTLLRAVLRISDRHTNTGTGETDKK